MIEGASSLCSNYQTIALHSMQPKHMPMSSERACLSALEISCLSNNIISGQTEAAQTPCSAYAGSASRHGTTLYMCMLDLTNAFDSQSLLTEAWVSHPDGGSPLLALIDNIKDLHTDHSVTIRAELDSSPFVTDTDFKQGCLLAPDLFNIVLDTIQWL